MEDRDDFDLARFDDDFTEAPIEEKTFGPIPDGKYQVNVDKVEITSAKTTGNTMLKWTLKIIAPSHVGRSLFKNSVLVSKDNVRWLKSDLHLCGVDLDKLSDLPANLARLLDVKLEVAVKTKGDFENVYFNRRIVTAAAPASAAPDSSDDIPF